MLVSFIAKLVLGVINSVLFLVGLTLFIIGVLIHTVPAFSKEIFSGVLSTLELLYAKYGLTLDSSTFTVADIAYGFTIAIICLGILLAGIAVLGNIGLKYGIKIIVIVYFIITLTIFLAQVIIVLIVVIDRNAFECCGVDGYEDFATLKSSYFQRTNQPIPTPIICCKFADSSFPFTCASQPDTTNSNYMTGCYDKIWDYIIKDSGIFISIVTIILLVQLATLILTIIVIREDNKIAGIV